MSNTFAGLISGTVGRTGFNFSARGTPQHIDQRVWYLSRLALQLQQASLPLWDHLHSLTSFRTGTVAGLFDTFTRNLARRELPFPEELQSTLYLIRGLGIRECVLTLLERPEISAITPECFLLRPNHHNTSDHVGRILQTIEDRDSLYVQELIDAVDETVEAIQAGKKIANVVGINIEGLEKLTETKKALFEKLTALGIPAFSSDSDYHDDDNRNLLLDQLNNWREEKYLNLLQLPETSDISVESLSAFEHAISARIAYWVRPFGIMKEKQINPIVNRLITEMFAAAILFQMTPATITATSELQGRMPGKELQSTSTGLANSYKDAEAIKVHLSESWRKAYPDMTGGKIGYEIKEAGREIPRSITEATEAIGEGDYDNAIRLVALYFGRVLHRDAETAHAHEVSMTAFERSLST